MAGQERFHGRGARGPCLNTNVTRFSTFSLKSHSLACISSCFFTAFFKQQRDTCVFNPAGFMYVCLYVRLGLVGVRLQSAGPETRSAAWTAALSPSCSFPLHDTSFSPSSGSAAHCDGGRDQRRHGPGAQPSRWETSIKRKEEL